METPKNNYLTIKQSASLAAKSENRFPPAIVNLIDQYPENKRRPVNKTIFKNDYFQLTYNVRGDSLAISSQGDLVYSAIPYDTARTYIQRAAIQYLLHPEEVRQYIVSHKANLEKYLMLSIFQVTGKRVTENSPEVQQAYAAIFQNPLLEIQILGRLLQHDETGPLSANLAGKFLYSENVKTGIAGYVAEYLKFVVQAAQALPIMTDGKHLEFLVTDEKGEIFVTQNHQRQLTAASDIQSGLALLPPDVKQSIETALVPASPSPMVNSQPLLRSEYGEELSKVRKNYIAHSVHPENLMPYFQNVLQTENSNQINVVSDAHSIDGKLPFSNKNFNIIAGDSSDSAVTDESIRGIYVLGNHDLLDVLPTNLDRTDEAWQKWQPFFRYKWFKEMLRDPDEAWPLLPIGDHAYYDEVKAELEQRFPQMNVLHNHSMIHEGVRYVGLTIPVALSQRKKAQQRFIHQTLTRLLQEDHAIPTVIVSHAPLFNELSMLSPKSSAYNKRYTCSEPAIVELFATYNIIGAIHGHHHIPASSGRYKLVEFAGKERFVVCSIYSQMNTGFELMDLLSSSVTIEGNK